jgi:septum formation protein
MSRTVLLASASTSRFSLLSNAGITPLVQVSHVDEDAIQDSMPNSTTAAKCIALAAAKGEAVAGNIQVSDSANLLIIAADSMLDFEGQAYGKPGTPEVAIARWKAMRGKYGTLHTGHWMHDTVTGQTRSGEAGAKVYFDDVSDGEIEAYVASGEPLGVAGGFTHEGRSAAFIRTMDGDGPAVGGISLFLLRQFALDMGISWHSLWD